MPYGNKPNRPMSEAAAKFQDLVAVLPSREGRSIGRPEEPLLIHAGDPRVLLGGEPPAVDIRVLAEVTYQELIHGQERKPA